MQSNLVERVVEKRVVCSSCDGFCPVSAKVVDGRVVKVAARKDPFLKDVICMQGAYAPKSFAHPDRLMFPRRRVGERGAGEWRRVSWEEALDDIAARLRTVVDRYGPEAFAVATSNRNTTVDDQYFQTGQRHVPELRRRAPEPTAYLHPEDAETYGLRHGDWAWVETTKARVAMRADVRDQMPKSLVRVPHGWWKPESAQGLERLSGMWTFSDAQLSDDEDMSLMDLEQGIPHLKGVPCRVTKLTADELADLEARYGRPSELPPGPAARVHARTEARDFMYDPDIGDGVEWEAIELALYGKGSLN